MRLQYTHIIPPTSGIQDVATKKWADRIVRFLDETFRKVASIPFNRSESLDVTDTGNADVEFSVAHHLGRVPSGFILTKSNAAACVYDSGTTWTTTVVYLKCNADNVAITISLF